MRDSQYRAMLYYLYRLSSLCNQIEFMLFLGIAFHKLLEGKLVEDLFILKL